ncbi:MAG: HD domain-containing phosphohydrolase [Dehalococcoidales bacterium]|nr:HD domain-containing phosphohydrolase [Dehalococcoidales bacterium]
MKPVRNHHEQYDGTGYPDRLTNSQIPLGTRILAVADAYDAMSITMKNGSPATQGVCPTCGTKMFRIGKS